MRSSALILLAALMALSACGVHRPLLRPQDVPAYEARRAKRAQQLQDDQQSIPDVPMPAAAPQQPISGAPAAAQ